LRLNLSSAITDHLSKYKSLQEDIRIPGRLSSHRQLANLLLSLSRQLGVMFSGD
jgi:hypothetical protein